MHRSIRRTAAAIGLCVGLAALSGGAGAAPTPEDVAVAEALFREAKGLLAQGKYDEACPKLAESQRIDPAGGTLFALGLCYEAAGKTASAWVVFGDAKVQAERDKRADRVKSADEHLAALEKKLSFLIIAASPDALALAGLEIKRDDTKIGRAAVGVPVPVDPGKHRITASAPGFQAVTVEVDVGASGDRRSVEIPALVKIEEVAPPPTPSASVSAPPPPPPTSVPVVSPPPTSTAVVPVTKPPPDAGSGRRTAVIVLGGVGLVGVALGGSFGFLAKSQHDDAIAKCPTSPCADADGVAKNDAAKVSALVSDIGFVFGIGALGAGTLLWITAPRAPASPPAATPGVVGVIPVALPGGAAASVIGRF